MKAGSGNIYYVLETVAVLSSISFLVFRNVWQGRRNRTTRKAALKTMSELIEGIDFPELENRIDRIINSKGGYANNNVPETVEEYVSTYTSYRVEVKNHWYPDFSDVEEAVATAPCLLGFKRGSAAYGSSAGHMTACVYASDSDGKKLVGVMDGHKTEIVFWEWSGSNDFMSEFLFSKDGSEER